MSFRGFASKVESLAKKSGIKMDQALTMLCEIEALQEAEELERRATDEEMLKIRTTVEEIFKENPNAVFTTEDVLERAGVRKNSGTSATARWAKQRLAITYQPKAAE